MKTIGIFSALLLFTLLLCGCSASTDPPTTSSVVSSEVPLSAKETRFPPEYNVIESKDIIVKVPLEDQIFTDYDTWKQTVEECDNAVLNECLNQYNQNFFETNSLAVISKSTSGGMQYNIEEVLIETQNEDNLLQVHASYSTNAMVNSLASYYFFITLEKQEASNIEKLEFSDYCRD